MSIQDDFKPYFDGNGLLAPEPVDPKLGRGSDNGVMYSSEYLIILKRNNVLSLYDQSWYQTSINKCVGVDQNLHRAPGDTTPDEVDNHYGAYAAHVELNLIPQFTLPFRLWRQPQLVAAMISAKYQHSFLLQLAALPFYLWASLVIATSCINVPTDNTDTRRLSWLLIQAVKPSSLLCRLASILWYRRLHKDYGIIGMKAIASLYYDPKDNSNPYSKYWIE